MFCNRHAHAYVSLSLVLVEAKYQWFVAHRVIFFPGRSVQGYNQGLAHQPLIGLFSVKGTLHNLGMQFVCNFVHNKPHIYSAYSVLFLHNSMLARISAVDSAYRIEMGSSFELRQSKYCHWVPEVALDGRVYISFVFALLSCCRISLISGYRA